MMFRGRVLLAGGDKSLNDITSMILEKRGYTVLAIEGRGDVSGTIVKYRPHLVIVDHLQHDGMSGISLCRRIRRVATAHEIPVLFLARDSEPDSILEAADAGANEFLTVPYKPQEFVAKSALLLRRKEKWEERRIAKNRISCALNGETTDFSPGVAFGKYRLLGMIGRGSAGGVFRASTENGDEVALKILDPEFQLDGRTVQRFHREGGILRKLDHPGIVRVLDVDCCHGFHYIAMEYVRGQSLTHAVEKSGCIAPGAAVPILFQLASALSDLWRTGMIHRDVKPENILLPDKGGVKLVDFGLARGVSDQRLTQTGVVYGTPNYMSPEQIQGFDLDFRTDVYSLGATAYYMLTGTPPFDGPSTRRILYRHVFDDLKSPLEVRQDLPAGVSAVVCRMMAKEPAGRYGDPDSLVEALEAVCRELALPGMGGPAIISA